MLHKNMEIGDIHAVVQWAVADLTERDAIVFEPDSDAYNRHKICYVVEDNSYYILSSITPSIVWTPFGGIPTVPAADVSVEDTPDYWSSLNVEGVLAEIGANIGTFGINIGGLQLDMTQAQTDILAAQGSADAVAADLTAFETAQGLVNTDLDTRVDALEAAIGSWTKEVAASDETTALTTGASKLTFHWPMTCKLTALFGGLTTPQASGTIFTVDVNKGGATILSTKLTIDNTESTSLTAATALVISGAPLTLTKGDAITIDIDQIGDGTAKGLKLYFSGTF